jgi:hypothetical protein
MTCRVWLAALLLAAAATVHAQNAVTPTPPDFPRGTISGYLFGDWYDNLAGNPTHVYDGVGNDAGQANIDGKNVITRDLNGSSGASTSRSTTICRSSTRRAFAWRPTASRSRPMARSGSR